MVSKNAVMVTVVVVVRVIIVVVGFWERVFCEGNCGVAILCSFMFCVNARLFSYVL